MYPRWKDKHRKVAPRHEQTFFQLLKPSVKKKSLTLADNILKEVFMYMYMCCPRVVGNSATILVTISVKRIPGLYMAYQTNFKNLTNLVKNNIIQKYDYLNLVTQYQNKT